jgi:hypothetical protein
LEAGAGCSLRPRYDPKLAAVDLGYCSAYQDERQGTDPIQTGEDRFLGQEIHRFPISHYDRVRGHGGSDVACSQTHGSEPGNDEAVRKIGD